MQKNTHVFNNISADIFETAGKMFIFMNFCPTTYNEMSDWIFLYDDILDDNFPLADTILILNKLMNAENTGKEMQKVAHTVLDKVREKLPFQHRNIEYLTEVLYSFDV